MFIDDYKRELDSLTLSDDFKKQTVELMLKKPEPPTATGETKTIIFPKRVVKNMVAACFVIAVAFSANAFISYQLGAETADSARESDYIAEKDSETDALPEQTANEVCSKNIFYSKADRKPVSPVYDYSDNIRGESKYTKPLLTVDNSGGMGFEAYLMKSPSELEENPAYTITDEFDSLPVYNRVMPDARRLTADIINIMEKMECSYTPFTYVWSYPVYDPEGHHITNGQTETYSPIPPGDSHFISDVKTTFTDKNGNTGSINRTASRDRLKIQIDRYVSENYTDISIIQQLKKLYPGFFNDFNSLYTFSDYNIYGELNSRTYMYSQNHDYGVNIYNATVGKAMVGQYVMQDVETTIINLSVPSCWHKEDNLPAIDYRQALDLLYKGVYYSSCFEEITSRSKVSHIELVYRQGYYNIPFERYECYTLPFYKFYVDITNTDSETYTQQGLRTYAAYYVCAIHPDFIEISPDSGYANFN